MIESTRAESPAFLRHEYRTPVNHIMGYSDLLIDEAEDRNLQSFIPVFRQIREGGEKVLESIEQAFHEETERPSRWEGDQFRKSLHALAGQLSQTVESVHQRIHQVHNETLADLAAISGALKRLSDLAGANTLPECSPKTASLPAPAPDVTSPIRGRILIADDDDANRDLLRRRLVSEGHEVIEARNGLEVLARLRESACDLVLLDIMMPGMDGFQTLAQIKQESQLRELPVIMISALDELKSVVRCIEMGAVDYLPKPFNRVLLRARIGACLERKRLQDQLLALATRDPLTGLANRRTIEAQLETRVRLGEPFTAVYIDLNGFKKINDTYGHAAGDDLLRQVGERLRSAFRVGDAIGRWGGDEFVALTEAGTAASEAVRNALASQFAIAGVDVPVVVGASVGAATWRPSDTASELLHRADFAMYEEKLHRRGASRQA